VVPKTPDIGLAEQVAHQRNGLQFAVTAFLLRRPGQSEPVLLHAGLEVIIDQHIHNSEKLACLGQSGATTPVRYGMLLQKIAGLGYFAIFTCLSAKSYPLAVEVTIRFEAEQPSTSGFLSLYLLAGSIWLVTPWAGVAVHYGRLAERHSQPPLPPTLDPDDVVGDLTVVRRVGGIP